MYNNKRHLYFTLVFELCLITLLYWQCLQSLFQKHTAAYYAKIISKNIHYRLASKTSGDSTNLISAGCFWVLLPSLYANPHAFIIVVVIPTFSTWTNSFLHGIVSIPPLNSKEKRPGTFSLSRVLIIFICEKRLMTQPIFLTLLHV